MRKIFILICLTLLLVFPTKSFAYPPLPVWHWSDAIDSDIVPDIDDAYDLGSATYQFKDGYFDGTLEADIITEGGDPVLSRSEMRELNKLDMTNGDTQTAITEAQLLANGWVSNQGDTVETDIQLVAVSYPIILRLSEEEALVMEICPPTGETLKLNNVSLDANDCVDSPGDGGDLATAYRIQNASGTWYWHIISTLGNWVDTGATD